MRKKRRILIYITATILILTLSFSLVQIYKIYREYEMENKQHQQLLAYKPSSPNLSGDGQTGKLNPDGTEKTAINSSVIDLRERYPDTVGWLSIDGTKIDYPFVQAKDNRTYLRHDMDLNYISSGTVFLDYRNTHDFSDFVSIIYGHQMRNDSMFGTMDWFREADFFRQNSSGRIYLTDNTLTLEVEAVMIVKSDDEKIYELATDTDEEKQEFIDYVRENAEQSRIGAELSIQDRFVLLSTCVYDFDSARMVLITRIVNG